MVVILSDTSELNAQQSPPNLVLSDWNSWDTSISVSAAVKIGLPPFEIDTKLKSKVILREIRRSCDIDNNGTTERWGLAIRLAITVQSTESEASISLPIIAAKAQLGILSARASITILGFDDDAVLDLLPNFSEMNTETYGKYTSATDVIKKYISKHPLQVVPTKLATILPQTGTEEELTTAAVQTSVVYSVASGDSLEKYFRRNRSLDSDSKTIASQVWSSLTDGQAAEEYPSDLANARAQKIISQLE
ncbi:hypothetical protein [Rathayibacter sp. AY1A7]|uniref:hypothetical protein n=1 Tax=Rathayibacter sp. AY1A7 TaxID=2080524 RepID=UPI0011AFEFA3|nr:hypothetical protein [Rathayibacter sp. AY1A7]